jgi:hypothetical protein
VDLGGPFPLKGWSTGSKPPGRRPSRGR